MDNVPKKMLDNVENTIKRFSLFVGKDVYVAYSGGKDSFFLCLVLKELGYEVHPIIIDIGYNSEWSIAHKNTENIGIKSIKIDLKQINQCMPEIKAELEINLRNIKKIQNGDFRKATICTPCHNSKMLILQRWAEINNINTIANGHHAIDAISSMLKSFYMYLDRWEFQHQEFIYDNFNKLILSQRSIYTLEKEEFMASSLGRNIIVQIENRNVGTDEPILQYLGDTPIRVCRPLFYIFENQIIEYFNKQNMVFNESECFRTNYRNKEVLTPRELVQYELLKNASKSLLCYLLELAESNLDENGFLKFNVRNNRKKILGNSYKNEIINNIKK